MLQPRTEAELAEAIAGAKEPLRIMGGGTRPVGRPVSGEGLSVAGLSGISLYEPGALTILAQAGTPLAEVEATLAAQHQRLPFEPPDYRALLGTAGTPTIGAVAAMNLSGPRRIQVGAARDFMLGLRFVDGTGTIIRNGGRVMKNVTGYDLVKLLAGSYGTLGVISEVAFKVLPVPETEATLTVHVTDEVAAIDAMAAALGSPFEVTGAAFGPSAASGGWPVHLRIEGFAASVAYRTGRISSLLGTFGRIDVSPDAAGSAAIWQGIKDVAAFTSHDFVARVSLKPTHMPELYLELANLFLSHAPKQRGFEIVGDWGGGLLWVAADAAQLARNADVTPVSGTDPVLHGGRLLLEFLQSFSRERGGHSTLIKGPAALRTTVPSFQPEPEPIVAISAGLRAKFDPRGILNPGITD
jgi:glycolate oxidase FAD binding subunit